MANNTKIRKENGKSGRKPFDKEVLQKELAGIMLMLVSLFLIAAVLCFHPDDEAVFRGLAWHDIFSKAAGEVVENIHNPFGLIGARVSNFLVRSFLGYPSILPMVAVLFSGWSLVRAKSLKPAIFFFLYTVFMSVDVSIMFGLTSEPFSDGMSGAIGRMLAALLSRAIGMTGSWVLCGVVAAVLTFYTGGSILMVVTQGARSMNENISGSVNGLGAWFEEQRKKKGEKQSAREERKRLKYEKQLERQRTRKPREVVKPSSVSATPQDPNLRSETYSYEPSSPELSKEVTQPGSPGEPEMVIRQAVREKEADLDERQLKVKTKDREPYRIPSIDLLDRGSDDDDRIDEQHLTESKRRLLEKLSIYKIDVVRISTTVGPRVTLFEMELAPDVKISRVKSLEDDLAMALAARGIRIIAPIPGKNAVGVEIPNGKPKTVWLRSVLQVEKFKNTRLMLPVVLGKTIANEVYIDDLTAMPHLLIAGATGAGKSVCINVIISSLLYSCSPDKVKFVLIDPKRVELFHYQHLKNHFLVRFPGIDEQIITEPQKAVYALKCVEKEMEQRYEILEKAGVRNIGDYNRRLPGEALPYLVVIIDELADLMITAGREVEEPITRLAQLSRAVGIHLIVATQRPSVDIITGIIKANFPSRIAFQVASKVDSRTILDGSGAEQLLGNGDMLYQPSNQPKSMRIQSPYVSSNEVEAITTFIGAQHALKNMYVLPAAEMQKGGSSQSGYQEKDGRDSMFEDAARLVVMHQQASVSLLQRRLRLGFSRAARVMDQLEFNGIVSQADGSRPREVLINSEDSLELLLRNLDG